MPRRSLNVLVLSDFKGANANVIRDFLYCFNKHSQHRFSYLHSWPRNNFARMRNLDLAGFDAILLFWDYYWVGSIDPASRYFVPDWVAERIAAAPGLKIQFLQDEYRDVYRANEAMSRLGVNLMFSCVASRDADLFYPKSRIPSLLATYPVLTGYVPTYLEKIDCPASAARPIDIGYRSRDLPHYLGSLGREKTVIAERFQKIAAQFGFRADISVREDDRLYGDQWLAFLRSCRLSLGTESGASVVDFDGKIKIQCEEYLRYNPGAFFEDVKKLFFADIDGKVVIQTISPRIFEAAAFENAMVLHEGHYEGMLTPDEHYISVKKDYSNVDEVVERMRDRAFCERIARNAKDVLIESRRYNYESFAKQFDAILERHIPAPRREKESSRTVFYFTNYLYSDRVIPYRDSATSFHHWIDLTKKGGIVPTVLTVLYSSWLIINFLAQASQTRTKLLDVLACWWSNPNRSLANLGRDLRILAILFKSRGLKQEDAGYELSLFIETEDGGLTVRSIPAGGGAVLPVAAQQVLPMRREQKITEAMPSDAMPGRLIWDHHLVSDSLKLPILGCEHCDIHLGKQSIYTFESWNRLLGDAGTERTTILNELLFSTWQTPTWWMRAKVAASFAWAMIAAFVLKPAAGVLKRMTVVFTEPAAGAASTGTEIPVARPAEKRAG